MTDSMDSLTSLLSEHMETCSECLRLLGSNAPVPNLNRGGHKVCEVRLGLIQDWADNEGRLNFILSEDEVMAQILHDPYCVEHEIHFHHRIVTNKVGEQFIICAECDHWTEGKHPECRCPKDCHFVTQSGVIIRE